MRLINKKERIQCALFYLIIIVLFVHLISFVSKMKKNNENDEWFPKKTTKEIIREILRDYPVCSCCKKKNLTWKEIFADKDKEENDNGIS